MREWPLWAVLAPGEPERLKHRTLYILIPDWEEESGEPVPFRLVPGSARYHAIVGTDSSFLGAEMQLAEALSLEYDEPVYSIERANDPWPVMSWRKGAPNILEEEPEALAKSLGCPLLDGKGGLEAPERKPLRKVVLVEGVRALEAARVLEEETGSPITPGRYRLVDTPQGLLMASGTGDIGYADMTVSEQIPHATIYAVIASPSLDTFFVTVRRGGEGVEEFAQPPNEISHLPAVVEIKGESSPDRILAALGIPVQWFRNE